MSPPLSAPDRLARLLSAIPWIVEMGSASIDEIATRFDYPREQLLTDLREVVFFVGVHPFTPDTLIDVDISDEMVTIHYADWFSRPLRLSAEEGARLLTVGRTMLELAGEPDDETSPMLRAFTKLGLTLGDDALQSVEVRLGDASEDTLDALRRAVTDGRQVDMEYYAYGRDELTERAVDPHRVFSDRGQWYLGGYCHRADADRVFRVDRIRHLDVTDRPVEHAATEVTEPGFSATGDEPRVTLRLEPSARWVVEHYPTESVVELDDGRLEIVLAISARPWLERMLLRLGPEAELVTADAELSDDLVASAARRVLARYRP